MIAEWQQTHFVSNSIDVKRSCQVARSVTMKLYVEGPLLCSVSQSAMGFPEYWLELHNKIIVWDVLLGGKMKRVPFHHWIPEVHAFQAIHAIPWNHRSDGTSSASTQCNIVPYNLLIFVDSMERCGFRGMLQVPRDTSWIYADPLSCRCKEAVEFRRISPSLCSVVFIRIL